MTKYTPRPERAAEIAQRQIELRVKRAAAQIKAGGGVGFQAKATSQEELEYYRAKLYPQGQFNPQAALELAARTGVKGLLRVTDALEKDFFQTLHPPEEPLVRGALREGG